MSALNSQSNIEKKMGGKWMTMNNFIDMTLAKRAELARERATELRALANQAQKNANTAAAIAKNLNAKAKAENAEGKTRKNRNRKSKKSRRN